MSNAWIKLAEIVIAACDTDLQRAYSSTLQALLSTANGAKFAQWAECNPTQFSLLIRGLSVLVHRVPDSQRLIVRTLSDHLRRMPFELERVTKDSIQRQRGARLELTKLALRDWLSGLPEGEQEAALSLLSEDAFFEKREEFHRAAVGDAEKRVARNVEISRDDDHQVQFLKWTASLVDDADDPQSVNAAVEKIRALMLGVSQDEGAAVTTSKALSIAMEAVGNVAQAMSKLLPLMEYLRDSHPQEWMTLYAQVERMYSVEKTRALEGMKAALARDEPANARLCLFEYGLLKQA